MSLAELNTLRRTARDLGIEGASKMNLADVKEALARHAADEKHFADTMQREEDEQDTPEAAAAYEKAMNPPQEFGGVIGTCESCGEAIEETDKHESDDTGLWCADCMTQPLAGPQGVEAAMRTPLDVVAEPSGDGTDPADEPRHDCADPDCAVAAAAATAVETRENERTRIIALDPNPNRAVLDTKVNGRSFRHAAIPGLHVTVCMKARPTAKLTTGSLDSVDCLDCLDEIVKLAQRP